MVRAFDTGNTIPWVTKVLVTVLLCEIFLGFPLWLQDRAFPLTPIADWAHGLPETLSQALLYIAIAGLIFTLFSRNQKLTTASFLIFLIPFVVLMLQEWNRAHPFTYLSVPILIGLLVSKRENEALSNSLRLMVCLIYFWAGFWKMNVTFFTQVAPVFLSPVLLPLQDILEPIPIEPFARLLIIPIPFFEMATGIFLLFPRTREADVAMGGIMLAVILYCLGPYGIAQGHITPILFWNIFLFALDILLFHKQTTPVHDVLIPKHFYHGLILIVFGLLPLLSPFGAWPNLYAFRLWAGSTHEANIVLPPETDKTKLPEDIQTVFREIEHLPGPFRNYFQGNIVSICLWTFASYRSSPFSTFSVYETAAKSLCSLCVRAESAPVASLRTQAFLAG